MRLRQRTVRVLQWTLTTGPKVLAAIALAAVVIAMGGCATFDSADNVVPVYGDTTWTPQGHRDLCINLPDFPACASANRKD
jgi:hypothetical protein